MGTNTSLGGRHRPAEERGWGVLKERGQGCCEHLGWARVGSGREAPITGTPWSSSDNGQPGWALQIKFRKVGWGQMAGAIAEAAACHCQRQENPTQGPRLSRATLGSRQGKFPGTKITCGCGYGRAASHCLSGVTQRGPGASSPCPGVTEDRALVQGPLPARLTQELQL